MNRALAQQALDALEKCTYDEEGYLLNPDNEDVIEALRAELGSKRQERRARVYTALLIEARMLGGGKNLWRAQPLRPSPSQIRDLRLYIEDLRRKL